MRISVIGCGHVGLVTGGCLAAIGHQVLCADKDEAKIQALHAGGLPIFEPHLDGILDRGRCQGRLAFTGDLAEAVRSGEALFICVGAPVLETGATDLSAVERAARVIAAESSSPKLVVVRSTVPVQTARQLKGLLMAYGRKARVAFRVASNPGFVREGTAVEDFFHPSRILVGVEDETAGQLLTEIYRPILERRFDCPVHAAACPPLEAPQLLITTIESAELIKFVSNSFLALKISYANALADLCERLGADVDEVTRGIGLDPRIGQQFLRAGLGFGGARLPNDIRALLRLTERSGLDFALLKEAERINKLRIDQFLEKTRRALWVLQDKEIGMLGLAYTAHSDDVRGSPAIELVRRLLAEGARICAFDPQAMENARALFPALRCAADPYAAAEGADALMIATAWPEFHDLDWKRIRNTMARPLILDGRNLLDPSAMHALRFEYHSLGRPDQQAGPR